MPEYHCLLDTSALLKRYLPETGSELIDQLFDRVDVACHTINISAAEIYAALLRWRLKGSITVQTVKDAWQAFKKERDQHSLIIHHIHQGNTSNINSIFEASLQVPVDTTGRKKPVGSVDVLVLSTYQELRKRYGTRKTYLVTADDHMAKVAKEKYTTCVFNPNKDVSIPF